ncbi:16S rRNA (guanine(527)-N(7))-methyltransferase RsmG [Candidatus Peribacteria bacterium]|jgi:16S rRNA (guanine527-N7)-methyltransferase|nr:16S rRNA (guanine(527)-N(7))-methyltransferase RsmG [Candidatus Peribacteria bacterium]MBT4021746.1 16S rRNA (guanine(527)-N(7))-methyltransferase RsmG [Candidatus Peribacteria bacterium]MBT4240877.1 16S rRNA (guanine(527)-N(7))-methyltransferase RsmG [Candidatus Peribacteria bacterium]MBT4474662.1 16S rRNA (guanine(527)-N(7))-methyltransferase RsmG [Candidatus Peribacteria bacterium]
MIIPKEKEQKLRELLKVFLEENKKVNLSAYREEQQCWVGNILDSVASISALEDGGAILNSKILDLGTGGGFPLLPLAIMFPDASFVGMDATNKKIEAVRRIAERLDIKNVELVSGRAEALGHDARYREQFDYVLSRAVAPMNVLLEYMSPFCKKSGKMICWKSMNCEDELTESVDARIALKSRLIGRHSYSLDDAIDQTSKVGLPAESKPSELQYESKNQENDEKSRPCAGWGERQILIFEKTGVLPNKFPRGVGEAKQKPL